MYFSENKLRSLARISDDITTEQIVNAINSIGFEVEEVKKWNTNKGMRFGLIEEVYKNPSSAKLNVCKIKFSDKDRVIQTTAENVKAGQYVLAFVPGSMFGDVKIKEKEMAGIVSEGMLSSLSELGFDEKLFRNQNWRDDIFTYDSLDLSTDPIEYLGLSDNIIDITILTNRSDAQSYLVMANELAAFFKTENCINKYRHNLSFKNYINSKKYENKITIDSPELNGFEVHNNFNDISLEDIILLLKSNIQLKNPLDDLSSLSLIMTGVSSRMYDINNIGSSLSVSVSKNQKFKINNEDHKIEGDLSFVKDSNKKLIGLAGIDVFDAFKATETSKEIFVEIGNYATSKIRSNSRSSKISNGSSINNSREISNGSKVMAKTFISSFFDKSSEWIIKDKNKINRIEFSKDYLISYAGFDITKHENYYPALNSLKILGFKFIYKYVYPPFYRHDIHTMQDICEEIFRFFGLDNFKAKKPTNYFSKVSKIFNFETPAISLGFTRVWTYTLISEKENVFNPLNFHKTINLKTFVSEAHNSIRNSMALSLYEIVDYNSKKNVNDINIFDIGMINDKRAISFASNNKSYLEMLENIQQITNVEFTIKESKNDKLHPNYNAILYLKNKKVGWIGKLHPNYKEHNIIFAEILIDELKRDIFAIDEVNHKPWNKRDITISFESKNDLNNFYKFINKHKFIKEIKLISTYFDNGINKYSYRFWFDENDLNDFEQLEKNILENLK